jgi:hypothetical protein
MSTHFHPSTLVTDRLRKVLSVRDFARQKNLDEKQARDLMTLFGSYATRQELLSNCTLPRRAR